MLSTALQAGCLIAHEALPLALVRNLLCVALAVTSLLISCCGGKTAGSGAGRSGILTWPCHCRREKRTRVVCMCVCMCVRMCGYMRYTHVSTCMGVHCRHGCLRTWARVCACMLCACAYVCMHPCICTHICASHCAYVYTCTYMSHLCTQVMFSSPHISLYVCTCVHV